MKFRSKTTLALVLTLGTLTLTGCSSLPGWSSPQVVDDQKIALVDAWAARNNVTVIWVNQPRRTKPETVASPSS